MCHNTMQTMVRQKRNGNAQSTKWKENSWLQQNKATNALKPLSAPTYIIQLLGNVLYAATHSSLSDSHEDTTTHSFFWTQMNPQRSSWT